MAVNRPRFDAEAVERMRAQYLAGLVAASRDPTRVSSEQWMALAFAGHPYGRPANGTPQSVGGITRDDLVEFRARTFAKDTLRVVAVGDIDAATLGTHARQDLRRATRQGQADARGQDRAQGRASG